MLLARYLITSLRNRQFSDIEPNLITLLNAIKDGWTPPDYIDRQTWERYRDIQEISPLKGFIGYCCSYNGLFFKSYGGHTSNQSIATVNWAKQQKNILINKLAPKLKNSIIVQSDYLDIIPTENNIIYCDPPYKGTANYGNTYFDSEFFWETMREWSSKCLVLISEYVRNAPKDFTNLWTYERVSTLAWQSLAIRTEGRTFLSTKIQ